MTEDEQHRKLEQCDRKSQELFDELIAILRKLNDGLEGLNSGIET